MMIVILLATCLDATTATPRSEPGAPPPVMRGAAPLVAGLTKPQEAMLRGEIFTHGLSTTVTRSQAGKRILPRTELSIRTPVSDLHKENRIGVLKLLLAIAKVERPRDAVAAAATAIGLETTPFHAVDYAYMDLDTIDKVREGGEETRREQMVREVEKLLAK